MGPFIKGNAKHQAGLRRYLFRCSKLRDWSHKFWFEELPTLWIDAEQNYWVRTPNPLGPINKDGSVSNGGWMSGVDGFVNKSVSRRSFWLQFYKALLFVEENSISPLSNHCYINAGTRAVLPTSMLGIRGLDSYLIKPVVKLALADQPANKKQAPYSRYRRYNGGNSVELQDVIEQSPNFVLYCERLDEIMQLLFGRRSSVPQLVKTWNDHIKSEQSIRLSFGSIAKKHKWNVAALYYHLLFTFGMNTTQEVEGGAFATSGLAFHYMKRHGLAQIQKTMGRLSNHPVLKPIMEVMKRPIVDL
jgi:hypothetical protein